MLQEAQEIEGTTGDRCQDPDKEITPNPSNQIIKGQKIRQARMSPPQTLQLHETMLGIVLTFCTRQTPEGTLVSSSRRRAMP